MKERDKLIKAYKRCKKEREEYLEGWKRARAEFENQKKKEGQRMKDFLEIEKQNFFLKLLPVLDNFKRAEKEAKKSGEKDNVIEGFLKIKEQLEEFLKKEGLEEISSVGEEFDPNFHEAIEMVETEKGESGQIIEEIERGYKINNIIIRPAKVKVIK